MPVSNGCLGEIGIHRSGADPDENCKIMRVEALCRTDIDRGIAAKASANEVRMHCRCSQYHRYCNALCINIHVSEEEFSLP